MVSGVIMGLFTNPRERQIYPPHFMSDIPQNVLSYPLYGYRSKCRDDYALGAMRWIGDDCGWWTGDGTDGDAGAGVCD